MRLACFSTNTDHARRVGIVRDDGVTEIAEPWVTAMERCAGENPAPLTETGRTFSLDACTFLPPLPTGGRGLFCVGMNYREHDEEARRLLKTPPPAEPVIFWKLADTMVGAAADMALDPLISDEFDWEIELGVVIGRRGRHIGHGDVAAHIAGFTIVNDVTARDLQRRHVQWFLGKNVHASSPVGPWVSTLDEAGYPPALEMELTVNGVQKQRANTTDLIFNVTDLVVTLSRTIELVPGDVISSGTPQGVGFARQPPEYLQVGDVVEARIDGLGTQRNEVVGFGGSAGAVRPMADTTGVT